MWGLLDSDILSSAWGVKTQLKAFKYVIKKHFAKQSKSLCVI